MTVYEATKFSTLGKGTVLKQVVRVSNNTQQIKYSFDVKVVTQRQTLFLFEIVVVFSQFPRQDSTTKNVKVLHCFRYTICTEVKRTHY